MTIMTGGCACGAKRFAAQIGEEQGYLCHCRMCQRASGNVSLAMVTLPQSSVSWEGEEPDWYCSSAIAERPYCAKCGTTLGFRYLEGTDKMDLTVAAFDEPGYFIPQHHFGTESMHRTWLNTEGLPEMRSDDYKPLQERWKEVGASSPQGH